MGFKKIFILSLVLLVSVCQLMSEATTYKILFIQSYTPKTPWSDETLQALQQGLESANVLAEITTEYLVADYLN